MDWLSKFITFLKGNQSQDDDATAKSTSYASIEEKKTVEACASKTKEKVGMAPYGTIEYQRNAAEVLSCYAGHGLAPETRAKLEALAQSDDPETKRIAENALWYEDERNE